MTGRILIFLKTGILRHILFACFIMEAFSVGAQRKVLLGPNTVISMDTTKFRIQNFFGSEGRRSVSLTSKDSQKHLYMYISTSYNFLMPDSIALDTIGDHPILQMLKFRNDTLDIVKVYKIRKDQYTGMVMISKLKKAPYTYGSSIALTLFNPHGNLDVVSTQPMHPTEIQGLKAVSHEEEVLNLVKSTQIFDMKVLDSLESTLKAYYHLEVVPLPLRNKYTWGIKENEKWVQYSSYDRDSVPSEILESQDEYRKRFKHSMVYHSFRGKLSASPPLQHKIIEIHIPMDKGYQIFTKEVDGEVIFTSCDPEEGLIEKNCFAVFEFDSGLTVKVPFTLTYIRKQ